MELKQRASITNSILFYVAIFSTMPILRVSSNSFFKITVIILAAILVIKSIIIKKSIDLKYIDKHYLFVYLIKIFTVIGAIYYSWGLSWKRGAIIQFFWFSVYTVLYILISNTGEKLIKTFRKGIIVSIYIQIAWSFIQIILNKLFSIDINTIVFTNILSMVSEASQSKYGQLNISGLAWHPINMAPVLIIAYCMFNKIYMKFIIIFLALTTNNSTVLIGLIVCVVLDIFFALRRMNKKKKTIKYTTLFVIFISVVVIIFVLLKTDFINKLISSFTYLYGRITGKFYDGGSTAARIRYYTSLPEIFKLSSIYQILFGYGEGCSGYLMSVLFNQYTHLSSWAVECDVINILIGNGVLGFILFYWWLIKIVIKGLNIDKRYLICTVSLIICGITYNVQYDWVIIFEMFMVLSIKYNYNIFKIKM